MMNLFFLSNAYCGSDECMKELEFADMKKFPRCPVFLERFAVDEAGFQPDQWRCDRNLDKFQEWEANKDLIERCMFRLQGVPADLPMDKMVCDLCRGSRDQACAECSDWATISRRAPAIVAAAASLGTYIDAASANITPSRNPSALSLKDSGVASVAADL